MSIYQIRDAALPLPLKIPQKTTLSRRFAADLGRCKQLV